MKKMLEKLDEAVAYLQKKTHGFQPRFGLILGTGLSNLTDKMEVVHEIPYEKIPHFPVSTVKSHKGKLVFGQLAGKPVVVMAGRFHYYEGYSMQEITFPVRVLKYLGIELLCISNAAGSLNPDIKTGHLMIIRDHINLMPDHPLRGKNYDELGPRFPDMLKTYDPVLNQQAMDIAYKHQIPCHQGVYVGVQGPTLETPAEYKYMHIIGGDAVGMSTVPEIIVAKHMELKVFAISVSTDMGYPPELIQETSLEDVIKVAQESEPKVTTIITELIAQL